MLYFDNNNNNWRSSCYERETLVYILEEFYPITWSLVDNILGCSYAYIRSGQFGHLSEFGSIILVF
jgi:hypothetical protein